MNHTSPPIRPPIAPPIPAIPVREAPPPTYPPAVLASVPRVPPIFIPARPAPDPTEPDGWRALEKAREALARLTALETDLNSQLAASQALEASLTDDAREDTESLVAELSTAQARSRVLQARAKKASEKRLQATEKLRQRVDYSREDLTQKAERLRVERLCEVIEWLKPKINSNDLGGIAAQSYAVRAVDPFCPPAFSLHLPPSAPEMRPGQLEREISQLLKRKAQFEAEACRNTW
jgi:Fic family protein